MDLLRKKEITYLIVTGKNTAPKLKSRTNENLLSSIIQNPHHLYLNVYMLFSIGKGISYYSPLS